METTILTPTGTSGAGTRAAVLPTFGAVPRLRSPRIDISPGDETAHLTG